MITNKFYMLSWSKYNSEIQNFLSNNTLMERYPIQLAMLCGFLAGDGCISGSHRDGIRFYPDDMKIAIIFKNLFRKLYGKIIKIRKNHIGKCYDLRIRYKKAHLHLTSLTTFGVRKWRVPKFVLEKDELKIAWLKAFFDCEGYVNPNGKVIQIQCVNKLGINQVKNMLASLRIESNICVYKRKNKNWNTNFVLSITGENIEKFAKMINFNHDKKLKKLRRIIARRWVGRTRLRR